MEHAKPPRSLTINYPNHTQIDHTINGWIFSNRHNDSIKESFNCASIHQFLKDNDPSVGCIYNQLTIRNVTRGNKDFIYTLTILSVGLNPIQSYNTYMIKQY